MAGTLTPQASRRDLMQFAISGRSDLGRRILVPRPEAPQQLRQIFGLFSHRLIPRWSDYSSQHPPVLFGNFLQTVLPIDMRGSSAADLDRRFAIIGQPTKIAC